MTSERPGKPRPDAPGWGPQGLEKIAARIDTLTFDCYGTLIDWRAGLRSSFRRIFGGASEPHLDELFAAYLEAEAELEAGPYRPYREVLSQVAARLAEHFDFDPRAAGKLSERLAEWTPFPDTNEALRRLKARFRLGVLSNIDRDLFAATARHFRVEFDFVVTAEDVRSYKPAPGHFETLLKGHGTREQILHVAQSQYHDGRACARHGLAFAWINRYNDAKQSGVPAIAEFRDLRSLADALCS